MADDRRWQDIPDERERYKAYLCSRDWAEKREAVRRRSNNLCERCDAFPMDACHHLTYARKYNESLEDLQAICEFCHAYTHGKSDFDPCEYKWFIRYVEAVQAAIPYGSVRPVGFEFASNDWEKIRADPANVIVIQLYEQGVLMGHLNHLERGDDPDIGKSRPMRESTKWLIRWDNCAEVIERELLKYDLILWLFIGKPLCPVPEYYQLILAKFGFDAEIP